MATPTIQQLENELISRAKTLTAFKNNAWSVFSLDDLVSRTELQALPILGVGYNGVAHISYISGRQKHRGVGYGGIYE